MLNIIVFALCMTTLNSEAQNLDKPLLSFELLPVDFKKK